MAVNDTFNLLCETSYFLFSFLFCVCCFFLFLFICLFVCLFFTVNAPQIILVVVSTI